MVEFEQIDGSLYPELGVPYATEHGSITPIASDPHFPPVSIEVKDGKVHTIMRAYNGDSEKIKFVEFVADIRR